MTDASFDNKTGAPTKMWRRKRPGQSGELIGVRLQPDDLAALDAWIATQPDTPSRPEAIRRVLKAGLLRGEA